MLIFCNAHYTFIRQFGSAKCQTYGGRKKHPIAICLMLITELVCVVTLMREWTGLRIFGMTIAQCISKATHIYVGSAVTQSHVADFDF